MIERPKPLLVSASADDDELRESGTIGTFLTHQYSLAFALTALDGFHHRTYHDSQAYTT